MGKFKRSMEKMKQALGLKVGGAEKDWKPTSNARNEMMVQEARKFAQQLKHLHKDLTLCSKAVDAGILTMKDVMNAALPRAYDETVMGVEPVDKDERIVGTNVNIEAMSAASSEMKERLQNEVLGPLEQWLAAYRTIKDRNRKCEEIRLDLDTKRRSAAQATERYEKLKAREHKDSESAMFTMQKETDKMNRLTQRYTEVEAEVFNALLSLIKDTAVLREYAAAALFIMQRVFATSYAAFDLDTPMPMPALPPPAVPSFQMPSIVGQGSTESLPPVISASAAAPLTASASLKPGALSTVALGPPSKGSLNNPAFNPSSPPPVSYLPPSKIPSPGTPEQDSSNPFAGPKEAAAPNPFTATIRPPSSAPAGGLAVSNNMLPPPPAWYNEAKQNAHQLSNYDDSDDEGANPFNTTIKKTASSGRK
mmetsp:Transcript_6260/g.13714  ORF Transcript_6260/g.13714 Transcript_6260/m.13714 type:complete len:422 (+) Transcript_6260:115-1380(+)|eukprot:CAMPEP_0202901776 /NCGR_PEP_ID=MMETSP1392-20130828/14590_1 /ASSEMBLY_ACC=CAM_ASM_000868 /TAXON_ID=225041 /ORGANISM="Chlamydomonas chlamydogama, Strain SAG 11-48b" /LENGTH=421 /DNA_ID=CAMNT_0049588387 /DNA_START=72 /DNA_END=1337 /DNA_ORIENTATION=+